MLDFRKFTRLLLFLFLITPCFSIGQNASVQSEVLDATIDEIFKEFDHPGKPGAALAVVKDGAIVFKKGYGSANLEYSIPVSPTTVFHVASVSKQFTVFAILLLEEEGKLSLDDSIQKYIPEVPDFGETITLRHLATHTSGMRDQWDLLTMAGWRFDDVITKEHILKLVSKQKELNFKPGEEFLYCNTGFTLLAEVVARISGKSFATFTRERIFQPLKMTNTLFYDDHEMIVKNRAYSYYPAFFGYKKSVLSYSNVGATSLFTTVEDLCLWAMNFQDPKVGSTSLIDQMNTLAILNNGKTFGGAYGQFISPYKGLNQIQHSGGDAGYRSYLCRFPDQDIAVVVLSNYGYANTGALATRVVDLFLADAFKNEPVANKKKGIAKKMDMTKKQLLVFEQEYWNPKELYTRKIYVRDSSLLYDRGNGSVSELEPITKSTFKMLDVPSEVVVEFTTHKGQKHLIVSEDDQIVAEMDAYTALDPADIHLELYIGTYSSEELSTDYTFKILDGKLVATHARHPDLPFTLVFPDIFKNNATTLQFVRIASGAISGMKVSTGRVRHLWFVKE